MDFPYLLLVLLALPFVSAAVIVAVSSVRRRAHAGADGSASEPVHRLQADPAAVQDAAVQPPRATGHLTSGRERRADTFDRPTPH